MERRERVKGREGRGVKEGDALLTQAPQLFHRCHELLTVHSRRVVHHIATCRGSMVRAIFDGCNCGAADACGKGLRTDHVVEELRRDDALGQQSVDGRGQHRDLLVRAMHLSAAEHSL
jgi:hypothetical protein